MTAVLSPVIAGFGLGLALAGAPGPVQAIILSESVRGGVARGVRAQLGANVTFAVLLVSLALGVAVVAPGGTALRVLKIVGGLFLLLLAADGLRAPRQEELDAGERWALPPAARGILAVLLNPGAWLFLGTAASSLFSAAAQVGGTPTAVASAATLSIGLTVGDGAVVVLGAMGVRRAGDRVALLVRRGLSVVLGGLGIWLLVSGAAS